MKNESVKSKVYRNNGNPQVLALVPEWAGLVLDLGCGAGDNAEVLSGRGIVVDGVTLSEMEAESAREVCRNVYIHNLEAGLPAECNGPYDAVLASHVLEHICFPESLLKGVLSRLSSRGVLIVALPNLLNWRYRLNLLLGRFDYQESGIMDNTHFRWYTYRSAHRMLAANGFEVVLGYAHGCFPLYKIRNILPKGLSASLDRMACAALPGLFGYQLLYVAKKR
jgi:2-polyprenyl-3-methyl-5-hydroxy-6-metoxy-1,4-benzoquinol methylase